MNDLILFDRAQQAGRKPQKANGHMPKLDEPDSSIIRLASCPLRDPRNIDRSIYRSGGHFLWCDGLGLLAWGKRRWARNGAKVKLDRAIQKSIWLIADEVKAIAGTSADYGTRATPGSPRLPSVRTLLTSDLR
jgi:hypothetical protein